MSSDSNDANPASATDARTVPQVLFVCVHNAGRSQMAAALQHHAAGRVDVRSAGSTPADEINPAVRAAMAEIGIDLDGAHPKLLTTDAVQASDVVVTMGCGDTCPIYPGKRYSTGTCPTLPTRPSPRSGLSGTRSTSASANCLRNSTSDVTHLASHACLRIESIEHKPCYRFRRAAVP